MELMFGLSVVDQLNGGRQTKRLAGGWSNRPTRSDGRLLQRIGAGLIALGTRLAPAAEAKAERPLVTGPTLAGRARS